MQNWSTYLTVQNDFYVHNKKLILALFRAVSRGEDRN